jgi:hypothetical protein
MKSVSDDKKEAKRLIRIAYKTGGTVPVPLRFLTELGVSVKVIKAVLRKLNYENDDHICKIEKSWRM